ncbi:MAG TPA: sodium:solute symporter family protein [Caldithrix abyssi]|uniref:Sodium:solute symporter family protein n=1 Tax=Caldithrix abyssi TaxID=187145 RepID=A0A7V5H392_CALAY|nr:sodium:solute symporter family protein [Caldithrix abyssi]
MSKVLLLDLLPIIVYLMLVLWIGWRARHKDADENEFLLSGRKLTIPAFVATLVTTWYGGILGIGEFVYQSGISAWLVMGLPYYLFAFLFAIFLAPRIRAAENVSIPDMMYRMHNKPVGALSGLFIVLMTSPAPYILMLAVLLKYFLNLALLPALIISALVSIIYVYWGGFRSVVQTDKLQFVFMFSGFALLVLYLSFQVSTPTLILTQLDASHLSLKGKLSWQEIVVWFFIASWTFIDPGFHQRCAAAKSPAVARKGILISIAFWALFDSLTLLSGLYAFVLLPGIEPLLAYPKLASQFLPPFLRGLFFVGLFATIMSTIDSYTFLSAIGIGRDLIWELKKNKDSNANSFVRLGLIITGLIAVAMAYLIPSVVQLWYSLGSLFIPPLIFPVLGAYWPALKLKNGYYVVMMTGSFLLGLLLFLIGQLQVQQGGPVYPWGLEPFFPAMAFSIMVFLIGKLTRSAAH